MKQNHITTIMVYNMLNSQRPNPHRPIFVQNPILNLTMHYQLDKPSSNTQQIRQRIRSRSFYDNNQRFKDSKRKMHKNRIINKYLQRQESSLPQTKIIDLEFQSFSRSRPKKQMQKSALTTHQYYSLMVDSMQQYIKKVEKGKRKRLEKCEKIRNFGVNIQSINPQIDENKVMTFSQKFKKIRSSESKDFQKVQEKHSFTREKQIKAAKLQNEQEQAKSPKKQNQASQTNFKYQKNLNQQEQLKQKYYKTNTVGNNKFHANANSSKNMSKTIQATSNSQKNKFLTKKYILKGQKKDEDRKIGSKYNRMFAHFYIILSSFGVCLNKSENKVQEQQKQTQNKLKKNQRKYTYFVGKGNNKNLIVSILKKRWWWVEAEDISSANFVWTQIKNTLILQKQSSMMYSQLEQAQPSLYLKQINKKSQQTQQSEQQSKRIYNIFHKNHSKKFHQKLTQKQQKKYLRFMKTPSVLHNHYEANYMLGNKKALYYNMTQYKQYRKQNVFQYIPLTFHVQKINSKVFKMFEKRFKEEKKSLWIVKPGQNTNRGQGIFVSNSIEAIRAKIQKDKKHTFIIQKYVKNNLTFNRRKFDIRTYLLMVSIGGVQKFYWYTEGYLRTSSQIYDLTDLDDPFIHLTNDAIQSTGDNYGKFQKGNKVTYSEFQRYLDINFPNQKYSVQSLVQKMKGIAKQVVQATYFKIDPCRKECSFQLFGLDFLIDTMFRPWLLQVNTNPCLQLSSPVLQRLIPRMVQNLFRIAVDPVFQPSQTEFPRNLACYIPDNIIQSNRFELIFDSLHDRNFQWEAYSINQNANKVYEDQNQEFENDGEIIKFQD